MDRNNSRPHGGEPAMDGGDWRRQLAPDSRERIVNKILETLRRHLPFCGQEGLLELMKIATRFEEKIFIAATSQSDYLRKISLKMLTMGPESRNPIPNNWNDNSSSGSVIDPEPSNKRNRQNEAWMSDHDRLAAKEAELIVAQKALEASQEELKAIKHTQGMLSNNVELVEEQHIKLREAIVEKWMQSETGKASLNNISYFKGFEHAYRAKAGFGEDYLLKGQQFAVIEALPHVDCFGHDLELPEMFQAPSSKDDVVPSA